MGTPSYTRVFWCVVDPFDHSKQPGPWNFGKVLFFWVRYYTIALTMFDVAQIHSFLHFEPSLSLYVPFSSFPSELTVCI